MPAAVDGNRGLEDALASRAFVTHPRDHGEAQRTIRQNLTWAFGYNVIAMTLAFLGYLHPLLAARLMLGSSVFVLHNSLRLGRSDAAGP